MKKLAILHSGDLGNVSIGGVSQYIQEIIKNEIRYEVTLYGTCEADEYELGKKYIKEINGMKYNFVPITSNKKHPLSIYYFLTMFKFLTEIEANDIIYAQRMEYIIPFYGRKAKQKVLMAVHGSGAYTTLWRGKTMAFFYNIVERIAVNTANKVIVLQKRKEYGVPYYKKRYKKCKDKIYFGRVPIDDSVFRKIEQNQELSYKSKKNIIYLGRIDDNPKRVMLFPDIANSLRQNGYDFYFHLIGYGSSMLDIKNKIHKYNLEDIFVLHGKINHGEELTNLLNIGDVALILSSFEGICMSALECIACGTPVVATDVGDINSYICDGKNGIVIPNQGDIALNAAKAICSIWDNGCELNDVYLRYTPKNMISELEDIFERQ